LEKSAGEAADEKAILWKRGKKTLSNVQHSSTLLHFYLQATKSRLPFYIIVACHTRSEIVTQGKVQIKVLPWSALTGREVRDLNL
jgi:hypothetical protein